MPTQHKLTITHSSDEEISYAVNGKHIVTATHDEHGWSGMEAIESSLRAFAKAIGAEIEEVDTDDGDENEDFGDENEDDDN